MHGFATPHCGYCEYFESCFLSDDVTEWGYCTHEREGTIPPRDEIENLKRSSDAEDLRSLCDRAERLGLFAAMPTKCPFFSDVFPL